MEKVEEIVGDKNVKIIINGEYMIKEALNNMLDIVGLGEDIFQATGGIIKEENHKMITIGKMYIHQIKIKRDPNNQFEPLYSMKYEDMIFDEIKTVKNKTFEELVNFIDKQKLIYGKKELIEDMILKAIIYRHITANGIPFIVKEVVDFEKENLPMTPI